MLFLLLIVVILIFLYFYGTKNHDYWKKKGIKHEKPYIFVGNSLQQYFENVSMSERFARLYWRFPAEKCVGTYNVRAPVLLLRDPEMIKHVLAADFKHFHYRGSVNHECTSEFLQKNLFDADGDTWKVMRQKLTPTFTSGKLKAMFPLIVQRLDKLLSLADEIIETRDEVDIRELMAKYTTDFIGACGFGLNFEALNSEDSDFRKLGRRIFTPNARDIIVGTLKELFPTLMRSFHYASPEIEKSTLSIVQQIMAERGYKPVGRNDFIDMMLELKQKNKVVGESIEKKNPDGSPVMVELDPTDELLAAQVFAFFAAGFETSSHSSSFLLHLLAYNPEEQVKCQQEIDEVLKKYDGKICYDAIKDMKYLNMALREAIRILPSPGFLMRRCVKTYTFPGTDLTIDPKTEIIVSLKGLHHDPKYFEHPEQFRPYRFENENAQKYVYMPFGEGPRMCIGERHGLMQSMSGAACFGHYLHHTARREPTPQCHHCTDEDDTAQHTLAACPAWVAQRAKLCAAIGPDLTLPDIIRALIRSREAWQVVSTFCESIMTQKEAAERNREADEAADPIRRRRGGRRRAQHERLLPT